MSARLLDGRAVATSLKADLARAAAEMTASGRAPLLAALRFDGDDAAAAYAKRLEALCGELGVGFEAAAEPADASTESAVAAALYLGTDGPAPATALAVTELLRRYEVPLAGRHAVVVGRSDVIGKPLALLLLRENATVTICHSKTADLERHTRSADILVAATGRPGLITTVMVSPDATVVDVGTNYVDGKVVGDVDPNVAEHAAELSPVPGGVGPLTNLMLVRNLFELTQRYAGPE